jgi:hypothetical protein
VASPKDAEKRKPGRRSTGKITVAFRILPETKDRLGKAVAQFNLDSTSEYVESAILAQLKKDKVL